MLALLPLLWALLFYYLPVAHGGPSQLPVSIDGAFSAYVLERAGEVQGRWWEIADDDLVGKPYPSSAAKHPGIYEGLDLLLMSAVTSHFFDPLTNYHFMVLLVLVFNGWVAAALVRARTGSVAWAALATLLITVNVSTALNLTACHLNQFKYGWVLVAVWAYVRYQEQPTMRRGVVLGLAVAAVLGCSFYFGYFLGLALGAWWLVTLIRGRLTGQHVRAAGFALVSCMVVSALVTFPVWTRSAKDPRAGEYFHRQASEIWLYGTELDQYLTPPASTYRVEDIQKVPPLCEVWHYPGWVVLLALVLYALARLRGFRLHEQNPGLVDTLVGISAVLLLLSLRGGPATFLFTLVPSFRCYGRAGKMAIGLVCVAAPLILYGFSRACSTPRVRHSLLLGALFLALFDGYRCVPLFQCYQSVLRYYTVTPAWVGWLARQPADVRLAALAPRSEEGTTPAPFPDSWNWLGLYYRAIHRHGTLNGCEFEVFEADLKRVGASYDRMTPAGLRLLAAKGFNRLAFQQDYLKANAWIERSAEVELVEVVDDWSIYRARLTPPESEFPQKDPRERLTSFTTPADRFGR